MNVRFFWNLFKYVLAFGLLGWVVYANWEPAGGNGLKAVWQRHVVEGKPIHYGFLGVGILIYSAALSLTLLRWYVLVRAQDLPITVPAAFRYGLIGLFFNTFLPGSVGGDIIKAAAIAREQDRRTVAVSTVVMDRVIALWGLVWFVALSGGFFWMCGWLEIAVAKTIVTMMAALVAFTTSIWIALGFLGQSKSDAFANKLRGFPRIGNHLAEIWHTVWIYRCRQKSVYLALLMSWAGHVGFVLGFYCSAHVLWDAVPGNPIPTVLQHFVLVPMGMIITAMPLFPGGAGIGELGFGRLYELFGSAASNGVLGSLVQRMIYWAIGFVGYLIYHRMRATTKEQIEAVSELIEEQRDSGEPETLGATTT